MNLGDSYFKIIELQTIHLIGINLIFIISLIWKGYNASTPPLTGLLIISKIINPKYYLL